MLAYVLALVVALGSFALYMAAFFFPEVHRKGDLIWSGIGMFYALVLWVCAGRITGGVLLGQTASVALLGWLGWQTLILRRQTAPLSQQTAVPDAVELQTKLKDLSSPDNLSKVFQQVQFQLTNVKDWFQIAVSNTNKAKPNVEVETREPYKPLTPADFGGAGQVAAAEAVDVKAEVTPEVAPEVPVSTDPWTEATPSTPTGTPAPKPEVSKPTPQPSAASQTNPQSNPLSGLKDQVQGFFRSFNQPKPESKPIYVRKQVRKGAQAETQAEAATTIPPDAAEIPPDVISTTEPIADSVVPTDTLIQEEISFEAMQPLEDEFDTIFAEESVETEVQPDPAAAESEDAVKPAAEPIHPHPPSPDLVEAALKDAEAKHVPANPPVISEDASSAEPS